MIPEKLGPSGFLIIDKPAGITSFDVIRELRRMLRIKKLGHSGVLDKPAMGVLVIGANRATRLFELFSVFEKEYAADIWLGLSTTTDDLTGELTQVGAGPFPTRTGAGASPGAVQRRVSPDPTGLQPDQERWPRAVSLCAGRRDR